jgi:hypothetical protein
MTTEGLATAELCTAQPRVWSAPLPGSVDFSEFREFIAQAYPLSTQALVREVLTKMRPLTDAQGEV